jgi:2,3-bisphosphoglycerate-dependent phosphoglycerate mutase
MPKLILLRHGQSQWNLENRFTGWWDVDVTEKGAAEAWAAGELLKAKGIAPDIAFTSVQTRAIKTLNLALEAMGRLWVPVTKDWQLNERHYGGLTGLDKAETAAKHGDEQVKIWRRSFDIPPPPLEAGSAYDLSADPRYAALLGRRDCAGIEGEQDRLDLSAWQFLARARQAPVGHFGRGHHRS